MAKPRLGDRGWEIIEPLLPPEAQKGFVRRSKIMMTSEVDIEFKDVSFRYAGSSDWALRDINLCIPRGETVLITGPSGSGKTTLCSCMNGLIPHFHEGELRGEVLVRGWHTAGTRIGVLASMVGMVFQDPESQLVAPTVVDEIAFGAENMGVLPEEIERRIEEALHMARLRGYEDRQPHLLSGGEQQACAIAAIYAMYPEIYVMDEPTSNLDPLGTQQVLSLVTQMTRQRGRTLVLVGHKLEEVLPLVDRVIVMHSGRIVRDGPVVEVLAAGDIPGVFARPPIVQLAQRLGVESCPLTADDLYPILAERLYPWASNPAPAPAVPASAPGQKESGEAIIEVEDLWYAYGDGPPAVREVNLSVRRGEMVTILGRNGSGKTTLVRHLNGLLRPQRGRVVVLGQDVSQTTTAQLARHVGFCFQNPDHQMIAFTVRDELAFGLKARGAPPEEIARRSREALAFVGLEGAIDQDVMELGKGQRQRLALAAVLTLEPGILVFDEPTTGQDPEMTEDIFRIMRRLNQAGTTILLITHQFDMAARFARRAVVMKEGQVVYDGPMADLVGRRDLLRANSMDQPRLTQLAIRLAQGDRPPTPVTVEEFLAAFPGLTEG